MATRETWIYSPRGDELCSYGLYTFCAGSDPFEANRFQQRSIPSLPYNRHLLRLLHCLLIESLNGFKVYLFVIESVVDSICKIEKLDQFEFFKFTQLRGLNEFTTVRKAL